MGRNQNGSVYYAFGAWHVRYWVVEEDSDGNTIRKHKSHLLLRDEKKHYTKNSKTVQQECRTFMERINALSGTSEEQDVPITQFWSETYLPHCEKNKRTSTVRGYKKIWNQHLSSHFAGLTLREYRTKQATALLTQLAENGLGIRSVAHVRSLASGMFRHAKRLGIITGENPWKDSGSIVTPKAPGLTKTYSLEEAEAISNALHDAGLQQEQLIFCLATFAGLRPGEIAGLQWSDVNENEERQIGNDHWTGWVHIRRSVVCGEEGPTKTPESATGVPLAPELRGMFAAWRTVCAESPNNWCFPNKFGDPIDLQGVIRRTVIPTLKAKKLQWRGLYSGRRSAGTLLTQLTGNAMAAFFVLRHKDLSTTTAFYVKATAEPAIEGMRRLGERMAERKALAAGSGSRQGS